MGTAARTCLVVLLFTVCFVATGARLGASSDLPLRGKAFSIKRKLTKHGQSDIDFSDRGSSRRRSVIRQMDDQDEMEVGDRRGGRRNSRRGRLYQPSVKERLEALAKSGQSVASDVIRRAKVLKSSPFEGLILRATWPDDKPVSFDLLEELVHHSIPAFKLARWMPDEDPYHMTTHKIWTKMAEKDWRTVVKATSLLHSISRECNEEACRKFSSAIRVMSRARNIKSPDHFYFDDDVIAELNDDGEPFEELVSTYAKFVLARATAFSERFHELAALSKETKDKKAASILKSAQKCLQLSLQCLAAEVPKHNAITVHTLRLVATDTYDLWNLLEAKVRTFVDDESMLEGKSDDLKSAVAKALKFYEDNRVQVDESLAAVNKLCRRHRIKSSLSISNDVADVVPAAKLKSRIVELTGGYRCDGGVCDIHCSSTSTSRRSSTEDLMSSGEDSDDEEEGFEGDGSGADVDDENEFDDNDYEDIEDRDNGEDGSASSGVDGFSGEDSWTDDGSGIDELDNDDEDDSQSDDDGGYNEEDSA